MPRYRTLQKTSEITDVRKKMLVSRGYVLSNLESGFWPSTHTIDTDGELVSHSVVDIFVLNDEYLSKETLPSFKTRNGEIVILDEHLNLEGGNL